MAGQFLLQSHCGTLGDYWNSILILNWIIVIACPVMSSHSTAMGVARDSDKGCYREGEGMKALSIRQPWAWMIVNGWKDIENREWYTSVTGRILVHASKGMTKEEYDEAAQVAYDIRDDVEDLPLFEEIERGGIIGSIDIAGCVKHSGSPWFFGTYGFVLREPEILPFRPYRGQLGFFEVM